MVYGEGRPFGLENPWQSPISPREASLKGALALAYLGDTVWDLLVRSELMTKPMPVNTLHKAAIERVNAHAQRLSLDAFEGSLTSEELDVVRRGQNAHSRHMPPKNQDPVDYSRATGLEALIGYLYLSGQYERIQTLYQLSDPSISKED